MERIIKNPKDYRKCDLLMRKTQPIMNKVFHKNSQLPFPLIYRENGIHKLSLKKYVKNVFLSLIAALLIWLPFTANATLNLPAIPSNSNLAKRFELSTEMVFRVKVGETYLPSGALIAYINGEIRGAQTASVNSGNGCQCVQNIDI